MNATAEFSSITADHVAKALCEKDNIIILFHHNPDGDATGSAFAISAPTCTETPFDVQRHFYRILKRHYEWTMYEGNFGQNATTLMLLTRRDGVPEVVK